jgi:FAD/FMN-containing dehydrogenase
MLVNDIHSKLNSTRVTRMLAPRSLDELVCLVAEAGAAKAQLSICGGRHAMGGQQFGADTWLIDMGGLATIQHLDEGLGLVTAGAGIQWPELILGCQGLHRAGAPEWGIRQKQTGADRLSLGGALSANIHGRGLRLPPIVGDVEAFTLVDAHSKVRRCTRTENQDLFSLALGGYGMFGIIADVTLRLMPRAKVERRVEVITLEQLIRVPEERDTTNWMFGDFQYSIDEKSQDFLRLGVFSAYHRIPDDAAMPGEQKQLREEDWERLLYLAHTDRARVFQEYSAYYLSTDGQRYWSDTHQLSTYLDNYHESLDRRLGSRCQCSEMITEIYVPRGALGAFMGSAADQLRAGLCPVIYGTIRLVERDQESFMAWAREPWACVIFNLHVEHTERGLDAARSAFRGLIDLAIGLGGSYYLTYHRWATRAQVEACHPRFREFLRQKLQHDPEERFTSDWYRHHRDLFGGA